MARDSAVAAVINGPRIDVASLQARLRADSVARAPAVSDLAGAITHTVPTSMWQGRKYLVSVYVTRGDTTMDTALVRRQEGGGHAALHTSTLGRVPAQLFVDLEVDNGDTSAFVVSKSAQNVTRTIETDSARRRAGADYATWAWAVMPRSMGDHQLNFIVRRVLSRPGGGADTTTYPEKVSVYVRVNPVYYGVEAADLAITHWGWPTAGGLAGVVLTWSQQRRRKSKPGFLDLAKGLANALSTGSADKPSK